MLPSGTMDISIRTLKFRCSLSAIAGIVPFDARQVLCNVRAFCGIDMPIGFAPNGLFSHGDPTLEFAWTWLDGKHGTKVGAPWTVNLNCIM